MKHGMETTSLSMIYKKKFSQACHSLAKCTHMYSESCQAIHILTQGTAHLQQCCPLAAPTYRPVHSSSVCTYLYAHVYIQFHL